MQRIMLSRDLGVISSIEAFNPRTELKPLLKASILAWSVDHSLRMLIPLHYSGALDHDVGDEAVKVGEGADHIGIGITGAVSTGSRGTWVEVKSQ